MKPAFNHIKSNILLTYLRRSVLTGLLVFLPLMVDAQETLVLPKGSSWKYSDSGTYPGDSWMGTSFNDAQWKVGLAKFGYGEGNEATMVSYGPDSGNKYITYYFRTTFQVADPGTFQSCLVKILRDDGAVVYLNGTKVIVSNMPEPFNFQTLAINGVGGDDEATYFEYHIPATALIPGTNTIAVEIHQQDPSSSDLGFDLSWSLLTRSLRTLRINEVLPGNHSWNVDPDYNQFVDWIELYNGSGYAMDLTGYTITDNLAKYKKWTLPAGKSMAAGEYLVIYADQMATGLHTNFSLSGNGERIGLFDATGTLVDSLTYPPLANNYSYGYLTEDGKERGFFDSPTTGKVNSGGVLDGTLMPDPVFSRGAGFYNGIQTITITCADPQATIRYTRDGSGSGQQFDSLYRIHCSIEQRGYQGQGI